MLMTCSGVQTTLPGFMKNPGSSYQLLPRPASVPALSQKNWGIALGYITKLPNLSGVKHQLPPQFVTSWSGFFQVKLGT